MPQSKKFIMTQDKSVCDKLIASGFCLLSDVCGTYTFANTSNVNFNFEEIDIKKLVYTNKLVF
jgi:hypothetical protein